MYNYYVKNDCTDEWEDLQVHKMTIAKILASSFFGAPSRHARIELGRPNERGNIILVSVKYGMEPWMDCV